MLLQPDSIRVMGDKATARETMKNAGVPTVPGSDGLLQVSDSLVFPYPSIPGSVENRRGKLCSQYSVYYWKNVRSFIYFFFFGTFTEHRGSNQTRP